METIPGYHLKTTLGSGGMSRVYLGIQQSLDRAVAIKVLDASLIDDAVVQAQFTQESKLIASLNHPNIVQVIDKGTSEEGRPFFVMPYVKSISLSAILNRTDISDSRKIDIIIQLCKALSYAHRNGVVHRDIKPDNILVDYEGHVRLVDFGIAGYFTANKKSIKNLQNISEKIIMGTDAYMAPEQADGAGKASPLSDIYSLGIVMHQLFFGGFPYQSGEKNAISNELLEKMNSIIQSCIQPAPDKRPASAEDLRQQLLIISQGKHLKTNRWGTESQQDNIPTTYKLLDVLKENPFGATYLINDSKNKRFLVIKKQQLEHVGNAQNIHNKLIHIQHPHIVRIFGTGKNQRVYMCVSEYIGAGNLQERLDETLTLGQWMIIAQQLLSALECAHSHNFAHGNLRPGNILFTENNFIKISDFGFLPHSYSEENNWYQLDGKAPEKDTDIYAAGVILFQLMSGKIPQPSFLNWRNLLTLWKIPRPLRRIVLTMASTKHQTRYPSAAIALKALQDFFNQQNTKITERVFIRQ